MPRTALRTLASMTSAVILGCGCVYIPIPPVGNVVQGRRLPETILETLLVKGRPKREVVAELGPPLLDIRNGRAIAYRWETETTTAVLINRLTEKIEAVKQWNGWLMMIAFDSDGNLMTRKKELIDPSGPNQPALEEWFDGLNAPKADAPPRVKQP